MKSITLTYPIYKTVTINVSKLPLKHREWLEAVFTDDENRTDAQWDLAEENEFFPEIIEEAIGDIIHPYTDIYIKDYEE